MQKSINHVDHVAWIVRPRTLTDNVAHLEKLVGSRFTRFARGDGTRYAHRTNHWAGSGLVEIMNSCFVVGDIDYADGLIPFGLA